MLLYCAANYILICIVCISKQQLYFEISGIKVITKGNFSTSHYIASYMHNYSIIYANILCRTCCSVVTVSLLCYVALLVYDLAT